MQDDLLILHALRDRRRFVSFRHAVPESMLSPNTTQLLGWYALYFNTYPDAEVVKAENLSALIRLRADPNAGADALALTLNLVGRLANEPDSEAIIGIHNTLAELDLQGRATALLAKFTNGEEVDLAYELRALANDTMRARKDGGVSSWASGNIADYLKEDADEGGLKLDIFGPGVLDTLKGLREGDNVAICAPTDAGKTSLLCAIAASFAKQRRDDFREDGRPILYLVNEGTAERITVRSWQTVVGVPREVMYQMSNEGKLEAAYASVIGGPDAIRIKNIHGKNIAQVEQIIEHHNPKVVITDMTGRIRSVSNRTGAANDIAQLEEVWNGMRELAALHKFLHMGTIQVSAEGFEMLFPPLSALQNSKTGIQTTLDLALMMGRLTNQPGIRGISTPKNKLARAGFKSENAVQTVFDAPNNIWSVQNDASRTG